METPLWALSIAYWFHMLATALWIGSLVILSLLVLPAAQKILDSQTYSNFVDEIRRRMDPLGWLSISILIVSGLVQMSASRNYQGFLSIQNLWSGMVLAKHLFFGLMVVLSGYFTWVILPGIRKAALLQAKGEETNLLAGLQRRSIRLMQINLGLGILVLLFTAIARSA